MKNNVVFAMFFALSLFYYSDCRAQFIDDWEARPTLTAQYKLRHGPTFKAKYEHRLNQNFSHYKKSVLGIKADYKIKVSPSWYLKPTLEYRLNISSDKPNHDLRYSASLGYKINDRWTLQYSPLYQQEFDGSETSERFLRNEFEITYDVLNSLSLFIFTENYQLINQGFHFDTQKHGFGGEYQVNKKNAIELKCDVKHNNNNKNIARVRLGWIFMIQ